MSLDTAEQATVIGVGVAVFLAVGTGIFKTSSLRGDMNDRWTRRVTRAVSALDEQATIALRQLRDAVDDLLPGDFDPAQAIADPAPLSRRAKTITEYYSARTRMQGDFDLLLRICPVVRNGLIAVAAATVALTVYYAELWRWSWLELGGAVLGGLGALPLVLAVGAYAVLQDRLAKAEILAGTGVQAGPDGGA